MRRGKVMRLLQQHEHWELQLVRHTCLEDALGYQGVNHRLEFRWIPGKGNDTDAVEADELSTVGRERLGRLRRSPTPLLWLRGSLADLLHLSKPLGGDAEIPRK